MDEIKQATALAFDFLQSLITQADGLRLEEVESGDEPGVWLVTVSYLDTTLINQFRGDRVYKRLNVDVPSSRVVSMKIREVERA